MSGTRRNPPDTFGSALTRSRPDLSTQSLGIDPAEKGKRRFREAFVLKADRIRANPQQVRQEGKSADDHETKALAESIQEQGLQQLIVVRYLKPEDVYQVVSGERRFVAMTELLGWQEIPVRLLDVPEEELMWYQLHENLIRKTLSPRDLAASIQRAKSQGLSLKQIAEKLKRSETWVQKSLTIANKLTEEALNELQTGPQGESLEVMYSVATAPQEAQRSIAREITRQNLGKREVQSLVTNARREQTPKTGRPRSAPITPFERTLAVEGGFQVTITSRQATANPSEIEMALTEALKQIQSENESPT